MLIAQAFAGFAFLFALVAAAFFGSAGTLHDGRGWTMMAVFFGCTGLISVWLWFRDKALLARRVKAGPGSEPDQKQKLIQAVASVAFLAVIVAARTTASQQTAGGPLVEVFKSPTCGCCSK